MEGLDRSIFILQVKVKHEVYYLVDLKMTLSKNLKDAMIFNKKDSSSTFDGEVESKLEKKYGVIVTCKPIETTINNII